MYREPDYEEYSLEELDDVLENMDRTAYPERVTKVLEERNKKLKSRQKTHAEFVKNRPVNPNLVGVTGTVYSPLQAALGSALGGPVASIYFIKANFKVLGQAKSEKDTLLIGIMVMLLLMGILPFLPDNFPSYVIPILTTVVTRSMIEKYQFSKEDISLSEKIDFHSNWSVLYAGTMSLVLLFFIEVTSILAMSFLNNSMSLELYASIIQLLWLNWSLN